MAEEKSGIRVPLEPTSYILHGDRYCWWLTKIKPKKDNPFEVVESDSLGYYPTIGDCLRSIPRKVLGGKDLGEVKELITAVESMERTMVELKEEINGRMKDLYGKQRGNT